MTIDETNAERIRAAIDLLTDLEAGGVLQPSEIGRAPATLHHLLTKCVDGPAYVAAHPRKDQVSQ
jgi:hypothetical protein